MIKAINLNRGSFLNYKNRPYVVTEREFYSPGKGSAIVRLKLKDVKTGVVNKVVFKTTEMVEEISVEQQEFQYLYQGNGAFCFMSPQTFEQIEIPEELVIDDKYFLKEGETYKILFYEDKPIKIKLPLKMEMEVTEAENAVKGDTVTGATKEVKLETGLVIKVPLFIKKGEKILVNTENKEYVGRSN